MVVYRVTPEDVKSGVMVGDTRVSRLPAAAPAWPASTSTDPALRVAFFALLYDQDLNTPMRVFARDEAGNTARADFDYRVFPKPFKKSRIAVDDSFLDRVVPAILEGTTEIKPEGDTLAKFLAINGELRRKNAEKIASFATQTAPEMLWARRRVPHVQEQRGRVRLRRRSAPTSTRARRSTGRPTSASTSRPRRQCRSFAANRGKVLFADELGIYGNCVIIDHGMGVQSLYAHLSSIDVKAGEMVEKEQTARPQRHDRHGRRRPPALHDAAATAAW